MTQATQSALGEVMLAGDLGGNNNALAPELPATGVPAGTYTNPNITVNAKGLVTNIANGTVPVNLFSTPAATATTPGGFIIGSGVTINNGVLSVPLATTTTFGIVKISTTTGLQISNGVLSIDNTMYATITNGALFTGAVTTAKAAYNITGNVSLNLSLSNVHDCTLTGNVVFGTPTNFGVGGTYFIILKQDATGSRTASWSSVFKWTAGSNTTLSTAPNAIDMIRIVVRSPTEFMITMYSNFV